MADKDMTDSFSCCEDDCNALADMFCMGHDLVLCHEHSSTLHNDWEVQIICKTKHLTDKLEHLEIYINQIVDYSKFQNLEKRIPEYRSQMNHYCSSIDTLKDQINTEIKNKAVGTFRNLYLNATQLQKDLTNSRLFVDFLKYKANRVVIDRNWGYVTGEPRFKIDITDTKEFREKVADAQEQVKKNLEITYQNTLEGIKDEWESKANEKVSNELLAFEQKVNKLIEEKDELLEEHKQVVLENKKLNSKLNNHEQPQSLEWQELFEEYLGKPTEPSVFKTSRYIDI